LGNIRGHCGYKVNNNGRFVLKADPFAKTLLAGRSVQCLANWDCDGTDSREFEKILQKFLHNHSTSHGLGDPVARNIYVVGGITNMRRSYDANMEMRVPLEDAVLAASWADNLFRRLEGLQAHYHGDVVYLGCGVAPDHSLGEFIHHFNGRLMDLVKKSTTLEFPKIHFVDLYTPSHHESWVVHSTARAKWLEEPKTWVNRFFETFKGFALQQGIESAVRRHARADYRPKSGARGGYKKSPNDSLAD
jgi:hypothetical protein